MNIEIEHSIKSILLDWGITEYYINIIRTIIVIFIIFLFCLFLNYLAKKIISKIIKRIVDKSKNDWDNILYEKRIFNRLSHFVPALLIFNTIDFALVHYPSWIPAIRSCNYIYMTGITMAVLISFFNSLNDIYNTLPSSKGRSIKGYIQIANIIVYFIGSILILSIILHKNPAYFLTGLGAFAAILMLVFKDTLLGLVAGIQLSANNMVKIGDWIAIPNKNTDGKITEITLTTVKVINWDNTISMLPSYTLVSETFINYRGIEDIGARRIQRSIKIDINSIKYINKDLVDRLLYIPLIKNYLEDIIEKINNNDSEAVITNSLIFIKYVEEYLKSQEFIRKDLTVMVRELQSTEHGLPIEIYAFSSIISAIEFEHIQTNIFDHFIALLPEFELRVFQNPSQVIIDN